MRVVIVNLICALALGYAAISKADEVVVQDDVTTMSRQELEHVVQRWNNEMRAAAANDPRLRLELTTMALAAKKIANAAQDVTAEEDEAFYWEMQLQVRDVLRYLMVKHFLDAIELPDMEPLAKERYQAEKDSYALVPERRMSSHILFSCTPQSCEDREQVNKDAADALAALNEGTDFAELVEKYSDDPVSKSKGGKVEMWLSRGDSRVSRNYAEALYDLEKPGDHSGIVPSRFGLHIIRLDDIQPSHYKSYDEVRDVIVENLEVEYKRLAAEEFDAQFGPVGELVLDDAALEEIFGPYKSLDVEVEKEAGTGADNEATAPATGT